MRSRALCTHRFARALVGALGVLGALVVTSSLSTVACSAPDPNARVNPIGPPLNQFNPVSQLLSRTCGSLDCHGSPYRNFRVYGYGGARFSGTPEAPTLNAQSEVTATYESLIGLEPEIMRDVVQSGGAGVERLTVVRKARNTEDHKGKQRIKPGSKADLCLISWLASSATSVVAVDACRQAICDENSGAPDCIRPDAGP